MIRTLVLLIALAGTAQIAFAETAAEDAYDYREAIMTTLRGHLVAASLVLRGKVEDNGYLDKHAQALANSVAELEHVFPEGSNVNDSEALPAIWEQPEKFASALEASRKATAAFAEAAAGGDRQATAAAFREVGGSCRGCHDDFRKQDD